jgi:hypothetical protein
MYTRQLGAESETRCGSIRPGGGPVLWSIKLQFRLHYPPPAQDPCYSPPSLALPAEQLLLESEQLCPLVSRQRLELLGCERHDLP